MVLPGSITAGLHDSTDDPDFFVQKASIDLQYYCSTVCSITSVLRQDADVEEISMQKEKDEKYVLLLNITAALR